MQNLEYAGNSLESQLPQGKNVEDWTISRDTTLSRQELYSWLSGIFDGDGWIGININKANDRQCPFRHRPSIQLTTTSPEIYNHILDIFEGVGIKVYERHVKQDSSRKWKCHLHIVNRRNVLQFISMVYPYTTRMKPMIDVVLEYYRYMEIHHNNGGRKDPQSKFDAIMDFYKQLTEIRQTRKGQFKNFTVPVELSETTNKRLSERRLRDDGIVRQLTKVN